MASRKTTASDTRFIIEIVALAGVALGTAVLYVYVANLKSRQRLAENLQQKGSLPGQPEEVAASSAPHINW